MSSVPNAAISFGSVMMGRETAGVSRASLADFLLVALGVGGLHSLTSIVAVCCCGGSADHDISRFERAW